VAFPPLGPHHQISITNERITTNPNLNALAESIHVTLGQVLMARGLRGYGVLPKSSTAECIKSNLNLIELSDEDIEVVNKITEGRNHRLASLIFNEAGLSFSIQRPAFISNAILSF
jgi:diketogulonate reductase-like aldo/keto reductase